LPKSITNAEDLKKFASAARLKIEATRAADEPPSNVKELVPEISARE
jgi:hypothetical protein